MMQKLFFLFIALAGSLFAKADYSIVFIHVGDQIPDYTYTAMVQARLFNPDCPIVLIANRRAFEASDPAKIKQVPFTSVTCESLPQTEYHRRFNEEVQACGFWRYTSERFLYLHDYMAHHHPRHLFHLENDVMLYVNLATLLPIFKEHYTGVGATFDNDDRCIPGIVYFATPFACECLAKIFALNVHREWNDMQMLAHFKQKARGMKVDTLPIVPPAYAELHPLESRAGHRAKDPEVYFHCYSLFHSIFDAAAIGQFLGGTDRRYHEPGPGFINESCVFDPSKFTYEWIPDEKGRRVPYAIFQDHYIRINNLHIHSKQLEEFVSYPPPRS